MSYETSHPIASIPRGMSGGGPTTVTFAPISLQRLDVRARDARVKDVADDRDVEPADRAELLVDRVEVEQCLGRVLVLAVAGVHDVRAGDVRDEVGRADLWMADDDDVRVVGADRDRGVLQRLALVDRRARSPRIVITSAESRFAASSKLADVRVDDS